MPDGPAFSNLNIIFHPKSIAVVGASTRPGTVGNDIFRNLLYAEFNGSVYPVNPRASNVQGVHAYAALAEIPGPVDLAVLIVPAASVLDVTRQAIAKGVKALVVISAGFKETGPKGLELQNQLRDCVQAAGVPLIGPNCLGVINTHPDVRMNAAFGRKMPAAGNLAFLSQSGALCTSVLDYAEERQMGFSKFISFGNKADVNEIDLLGYLAAGREDVGDRHVPGRRDQRPAVHRDCPAQFLGNPQADALPEVRPLARRRPGGEQPHGSLAGAVSVYDALADPERRAAAWTRSPSCSTTRRSTPRSPCPAGPAWRLSPTPAARASWPPTRPCVSA